METPDDDWVDAAQCTERALPDGVAHIDSAQGFPDALVPASIDDLPVRIVRSARRKKTLAASRKGDHIEVRVPAGLDPLTERESVEQLVAKLRARYAREHAQEELPQRAQRLNRAFLDGRATPGTVRWVSNQNSRWGSCTPSTGDIRISDKLLHAPDYVIDAVLIHELVHTFISGGHSAEFWSWADRAPKAERAKGYLEALSTLRAAPDPRHRPAP